MNYYVIPESLDQQIDRTVTFSKLKQDAERYKGKIVALGGVVLHAKNLKEGTQIEVLQLPLSGYDQPDSAMEASEGRFIMIDPEHHDPAVLQNRRVTVVGEVIGTKVQTIDEFEYTFPYLSAKLIHVWPAMREYAYATPYPYYYPYYPYYPYYYPEPYPYWYPPYWYYGPPVIVTPSPPAERRFQSPPESNPQPPSPQPPSQSPGGKSKRRFE